MTQDIGRSCNLNCTQVVSRRNVSNEQPGASKHLEFSTSCFTLLLCHHNYNEFE